ncbi:hypothetical protein C8Q78DRAFT_988330 [Trametes maxima]|nr:hypothetical protein C8Q78DRAFT_988330 [Trametes maxima]
MPRAYRSRFRCAYADPPVPKRRPAVKKRSEMTQDEKDEADAKGLARKELKTAKEEWEKNLASWNGPSDFKWPTNTLGMYKSDAKTAFGLTDRDMAALQHESIQASPKTFFSLASVRKLAADKFQAGALPFEQFMLPGKPKDGVNVRLSKKTNGTPNRRIRSNWYDMGSMAWVVVEAIHLKDD